MIKKILIVEDEQAIARVLELKLRQAGFDVSRAINGSEAIKMVEEDKFDGILLDLILPEKDGFMVLEHIRAISKETKVIILTNLGQPEDRQKLQELGISGYFVKSEISIYNLVAQVQEIIGLTA